MPFQLLNLEAVAEYLHLTPQDVEQRVKDNEIPFEKRGDRIVFRKRDIDAWASQRILGSTSQQLADYHQETTRFTRKILAQETILPEMLQAGAIASAMSSKTKASVLRDLVALAEKTGHLNDPKSLLASLEAREDLCSTGVPGGFALPHPRAHDPYLFDTSFIVVGRPIQEIHFGAPDGQPTYLFFLICCPDDRLHLHTLARICLIALKTKVLDQLRDAPDAQTMRDALVAAEHEILADRRITS
ncbi:MAG TPA: PTS sugar transporter subunit IIA [Candidatus Limnocylindrales bacterium]|nr:PTS sugar transporter subunit IIA [Candidatus Limnocylindrales bacterium]